MYMDDDTMTPRDRIGDEMLQRILNGANVRRSEVPAPDKTPSYEEGASCAMGTRWGLKNYPLASVYAPLQEFHELYDRDAALKHGTVFAELDLPFMGETVSKGGRNHV